MLIEEYIYAKTFPHFSVIHNSHQGYSTTRLVILSVICSATRNDLQLFLSHNSKVVGLIGRFGHTGRSGVCPIRRSNFL